MQALSSTEYRPGSFIRRGLMGLALTASMLGQTALAGPFTGIPNADNDGIPDLYDAWNAITGDAFTSNAQLEPFRLDPSQDQIFTLNSLSSPIIGLTAGFTNTLGFYAPGNPGSLVLSDNPISGFGFTGNGSATSPFESTTFNADVLGPVGLALHSVTGGGGINVFYSEQSLNQPDRLMDHLVAYNVGGNLLDGLLADFGVIEMVNPVLLGFEDIQNGGDFDFDDTIFLVDATPIPLPATMWLFAGGLLASGLVKRRQRA